MRDNNNLANLMRDRRSVLTSGCATLAALQLLSPLQIAGAQEEEDWPVGEPDEDVEADEWEEPLPDDPDYEDQQTITDETNSIQITVPADWNDISGSPMDLGPALIAAPDIEGYATTWDVPGIEVILTTQLGTNPEGALTELVDFSEVCVDGGRQQANIGGHAFISQTWFQCGGGETTYQTMAGIPLSEPISGPPDNGAPGESGDQLAGQYVVLVGAQIVTGQDVGAIRTGLDSLETRSPDTQEM